MTAMSVEEVKTAEGTTFILEMEDPTSGSTLCIELTKEHAKVVEELINGEKDQEVTLYLNGQINY